MEPKNLTRQLFYEFELGENKALALANRYNMLYGTNIVGIPDKISGSSLRSFVDLAFIKNIRIFDCTDNLSARMDIESIFTSIGNEHSRGEQSIVPNVTLITCGNQKDFGQVHFAYKNCTGNTLIPYHKNSTLRFEFSNVSSATRKLVNLSNIFSDIVDIVNISNEELNVNFLPSFLDYNKKFVDSTESASCTEMNIAEEQSMAINSTIAQLAFNMMFEFSTSNDGIRNNIIWANLTNTYNGNRINTFEKYTDYVTKFIFDKSIELNIDEYKDLFFKYINLFKFYLDYSKNSANLSPLLDVQADDMLECKSNYCSVNEYNVYLNHVIDKFFASSLFMNALPNEKYIIGLFYHIILLREVIDSMSKFNNSQNYRNYYYYCFNFKNSILSHVVNNFEEMFGFSYDDYVKKITHIEEN